MTPKSEQTKLIATLAERVVAQLREGNHMLAIAESCTGGLVASAITAVSGASDVFGFGVITYANDAKSQLLLVPDDMIAKYGAVSPEVAIAMADGARRLAQADIAIAVTGIAGPSGGSPQKPVGLVFIGLAQTGKPTFANRHLFADMNRDRVRQNSVVVALECVSSALRQPTPNQNN